MLLSKTYRPDLVVSKDEERPTLNAAHLHVETRRLLATNGHAAVSLPCHPKDGDTSGAVSLDALKHARVVARRKKAEELFVSADDALRTEDDAEFVRPVPEGTTEPFPDLSPLFDGLPQREAGRTLTVQVNAALLLKLAKAMGLESVELTFNTDDVNGPIRVVACGHDSSDEAAPVGVLMPLRQEPTS